MTSTDPETLIDRIDGEEFAKWYREHEWAQNIREGQPYFNGPSPIPPPEKHSPSNLLQCHRKIYYQQANAPAEQEEPAGIFWTGTRFEEDVIMPYLIDLVHDEDVYVRNSMWVDFKVDTDDHYVRFKGATDPCLVDRQSEPILPTEVKTKGEIDHIDEPNRHHRAQAHAYMRGLSEDYDCDIEEAVVIYGSRETLNVRAFHVTFDPDFWQEIVEWAADHTDYRDKQELPPADPKYDWECRYCDYRHRCGQSDRSYADEEPMGLLPGFSDYPKEQVEEYLRAHDEARLTPTLASKYPDLADAYDVRGWYCPECGQNFEWDEVESYCDPLCPACAADDTLTTLYLASDLSLDE